MRLILAAALALATVVAVQAAEPATIAFGDLADPAASSFVDPYAEMGAEPLSDLRTVVRLDARLAEAELAPEVRQRLEARREAARQALVDGGFDIEALLAQRWTVAKKRRQAEIATNPALEGADIRLDGYLIPAGTGQDGRAIGYLVPVVGMCSHLPAPPPNELVRLRFDPSMAVDSIYLPVRVTGTLRTDASDETVHLLDGFIRMQSQWRLDASAIAVKGPRLVPFVRFAPVDPLQSAGAAGSNSRRLEGR